MGILDIFKRTKRDQQSPEVKGYISGDNSGNAYFEALYQNHVHSWSIADYNREKFAKYYRDGKEGNVTVYSIVTRLARACAEMANAVEVVNAKGESMEGHMMLEKLCQPNDITSKSALVETAIINLLTVGDTFIYMTNEKAPHSSEYYIIPSESVIIRSGGISKPVVGYDIKGTILKATPTLTPEDTIFIRLPNSDPNSFYGLSPLSTLTKDLEISNLIPAREYKLIKEGGVKAIMTPTEYPVGENKAKLLDDTEKMINSDKSRTNLVLQTPMQRLLLGDTMADMSLSEKQDQITIKICNAYHFPKNLLMEDSTFNNMKEAKQLVYTICIPIVNLLFEGLGSRTLENGEKFKLNINKIPELKTDNTDKVAKLMPILTVNELRIMQGYPPLEGAQFNSLAITKRKTTTEEETTI